jgi:hypothetical protein
MSQAAEALNVRRPGSIKDANFNWEDPLDLEGELTEEERMVRDTARGYAQDKLMPRVLEAYRCPKWVSSASLARPSRRNMAAPASATLPMD